MRWNMNHVRGRAVAKQKIKKAPLQKSMSDIHTAVYFQSTNDTLVIIIIIIIIIALYKLLYKKIVKKISHIF